MDIFHTVKNIDRILKLLGYEPEEISDADKILHIETLKRIDTCAKRCCWILENILQALYNVIEFKVLKK